MIVSGLWKLAAMAGVIGVGLVAVFQAQKGLQTPSATNVTSVAEETQDQTTPAGELAPGEHATPAGNAEQNSAPDPFTAMADAPSQENSRPRQIPFGNETPSAETEPPKRSAEKRPSEFDAIPDAASNDGPSLSAKAPPAPGLDFRDQPPGTDATPAIAPKTGSVKTASFEEERPARLSDDAGSAPSNADPFAANEQPPRDLASPPKPFVRRANGDGIRTTNAETDPFGEPSAKPSTNPIDEPVRRNDDELVETPPGNRLNFSTNSGTGEPASDPLATSPDPFAETRTGASFTGEPSKLNRPKDRTSPPPAELNPPPLNAVQVDPFPATSADTPPAPANPRSLSFPAADESPANPTLGQPLPLRGNVVPADGGLGANSDGSDGRNPTDSPRSAFPNPNPALPKLPTEVPEPNLGGDDLVPAPRRSVPNSGQPPADDRPATKATDFNGDGTVGVDTPRGLQQPRVTIEKIAPQQAVLGEPLVYSVIVKNVGGSDARQVVVEDRIPKGTELTGTAPRAEMIDKKLVWRIGTLKPNEEKKISIRVIPRQEGSIGSVARVNFATEVAAEIVVAAPQLSFTANAPRQVRLGETFEMTFLLKNTGTAPASNVSVRDLVPDGLKHEAAADIECPIGKLGPDETREIVLQVTAVKPGKVKNRAILSGDGGIAQELESPIEIIGEQLVLTRSGHNRIFVDRPTVFTNSVKNDGNAEVKQVRVSEIVPVGMEFVEASSGGRFDPVERSIYWTVGPLPPGTQTAVSAKLIAKSPGLQHGKIMAAGAAGSAAALKSEVEVVGRPELQIETVGRTGQVAVGDQLTSKIQLTNHGSASAQNVGLSIRLPRELKLVEVRGAKYAIRDNNVIAFESVAAIAPKESVGLELVMEAVAEADAQMSLEISADHLSKPARRSETIQIAAEVR
jgi:uncharacterized repeat protein (TIGR01451 family)